MKSRSLAICLVLSLVTSLVLPLAQPSNAATYAPNGLIQPYLVKDINAGTIGTNLNSGIVVGNQIFFATRGAEIWRSDGTTSGTTLVPNTPVIVQSTFLSLVGAAKQRAYFNFYRPDSLGGTELWWTDGTSTRRSKTEFTANAIFNLNGIDYVLDGGNSGLWKIDDATGDISLAVALGSNTIAHTIVGNWLYYLSAPTSVNPLDASRQLWRTDGTPANTQLIALIPFTDIGLTATANSVRQPHPISPVPPVTIKTAVVSDTLYLRQHSNLWKSDGSTAGTLLVSNAIGEEQGYQQTNLVTANGKLFFGSINEAAGFELWISDGTAAGTKLLKDIHSGPLSTTFGNFKAIGNRLFFVADDGVHGSELWTSDGTPNGTTMVKEITLFGGAGITEMVEWQSKLYFVANDQIHGSQIWVSDGTEAGTQLVAPLGQIGGISPSPAALTPFGKLLFFSADIEGYGREPWVSDGTPAGTRLLRDTVTYGADSKANLLAIAANKVFFVAEDYTHGLALWASDGTATNTQLMIDLDNGMVGNYIYRYLGEGSGSAYFQVRRNPSTPADTLEVWRTDGSITGTGMITSAVMPLCFEPLPAITFEGSIYYFTDQVNLWRIDTTNNSISKVQQFPESISCASQLQISDNKLFLSELYGRLWRIEANSATLLQSITSEQTRFYGLTTVQGQALFVLQKNFDTGATLWKTDGTITGTAEIKSVSDASDYYAVSSMAATPDHAYITFAQKDGFGTRLWRTDGSISNTVVLTTTSSELSLFSIISNTAVYLLRENPELLWYVTAAMTVPEPFIPGQNFVNAVFPTKARDTVYFVTYPNNGGTPFFSELWRTDGTPSNTKRVTRFYDRGITQPTAFGSGLFFATSDVTFRTALWSTDGNSVTNHFDLPYVLTPVAILGDRAFFQGATAEQGRELWAFRIASNSNVGVQAWPLSPSAPTSTVTLPIALLGYNFEQRSTVTLTATLPLSVTFISDTLGVSPTVSGNTLIWQLSDLGFGQHDYVLKLNVPNTALGTRYPVSLTISSALTDTVSEDNSATTDIWLTTQTYLPLSMR